MAEGGASHAHARREGSHSTLHPSDSLGQQRRNKRRDSPISVLSKGMETLVHFSFPRGKRVANTLSILSPPNGAVSPLSPLLPPRPRHDSFV